VPAGTESGSRRRDPTELELRALDYISEGVMVVGAGDEILYLDPAMRRILGAERGRVSLPDVEQRIQISGGKSFSSGLEICRRRGSWNGEGSAVTGDGHALLLQLRMVRLEEERFPASVVVVMRDVTHERILEKQLLQSQQMELLDNVSIAVAHEFRNLLTVILAYTAMLEESQGAEEQVQAAVRGIRESVATANELTARLLSLTRVRGPTAEPVEVQQLIDDVVAVMRKVVPRNIQVLKPENLRINAVSGDRNVLYRALLNLCLNARDAMPEGGTLSLEADVVEVSAEDVEAVGARAPGRYVVISVTDTGVGMTAEIMKRIFEPFFTTKSGGTGLGLSAVKHGIEELGGWVKVYSEPGKGSCFRLYLPAVADEAVVAREREEAPLPSGEGKLILAVDDDALALRVMEKCLQRLGYRVLGAGSGEEALSLFRRQGDEIAAVVIDVVMPFMNGEELYRELRKLKPGVKALAVSGFPPETARRIFAVEGVPFVSKPYACSRLGRELAALLEA